MVSVVWISKTSGGLNSSDAVFNPQINTRVHGEAVYSHSLITNDSGESRELSFRDASGDEAFKFDVPDGQNNIFWKNDSEGTPQWAFLSTVSEVYSTMTDSEGGYYAVLGYSGPISLIDSEGNVTLDSQLQMGMSYQTIIVKYSSSGVFGWAIRFGSGNNIDIPRFSFDGSDNLYVIGDYTSDVTVLDTDSTSTIISGGTNQDMFVISFDPAGEYRWVANMTGGDSENITSVTPFGDHLYVTGVYKSDPLTLTPGVGSSVGFAGGFSGGVLIGYGLLLSLEASTGAYEWGVVFDAPLDLSLTTAQPHSSGVAVYGTIPGEDVEIKDDDDNVIAEIHTERGNGVFIAKFSPTGEYLWHVKIDAEASETILTEGGFGLDSYHEGRCIDSLGDLYMKFMYYGMSEGAQAPQVFDKDDALIGALPAQPETDLGSLSMALLKITSSGSFGWITTIKPEIGEECVGWELKIGDDDNVYMTGNAARSELRIYEAGSATPFRTITTNTTDFFNPFIISYTSDGKYRWFVHLQFPELDMGPFMKTKDTKIKKMNFLYNFFNSRLGLTSLSRVYLTLIPFPGANQIYFENKLERSFEADSPTPLVLALDGSKTLSSGMSSIVIFLIIALLVLAITLLIYYRG